MERTLSRPRTTNLRDVSSDRQKVDAVVDSGKPLRIVMVIQRLRPYFSGQGVQVEGFCRELTKKDVDATIVTAVVGRHPRVECINGYRIRRLRCDLPVVKFSTQKYRLKSLLFSIRTFIDLWQQRKIDLVHVHALTDALYASWLFSRLRRLPLLFEMTLLGTDDPLTVRSSRNLFWRLRYAIFCRCDGYVAISPALAQTYKQAGLPSEKLRVIPQGVDITEFVAAEDRIVLRRQLGLPLKGSLLIFVGSLVHRKGIDILLTAWKQVCLRCPDAHLILVGKNKFAENLEDYRFLSQQLEQVPEPAIRNLHLVGLSERVSHYLQASDIFVFPSRREGFGTVIIEAMACGLPCIVAELPGITDYIFGDSGSNGIVVAQENAEELALAIERLILDANLAILVGRNARQRVVDRFSFTRIADDYLDYYTNLVSARRARLRV